MVGSHLMALADANQISENGRRVGLPGDHCGKILWLIWVVLPPSTQSSWCYQQDKLGGSPNSVPAYLDGGLPARSTGIYALAYLDGGLPARAAGACVPAYLDGGLPAGSTGAMYRLTWMAGYQPDRPEPIYQLTWMGLPYILGGDPTRFNCTNLQLYCTVNIVDTIYLIIRVCCIFRLDSGGIERERVKAVVAEFG